jgi:hypothetical protein
MTQPDPYQPAPASGGTDLGRIAFILAIVVVVLSMVQQIVVTFVPLLQVAAGASASQVGGGIAVFGIGHGLVALAALILGILAARQRRSPVLAGIGAGIGGAGVITTLTGLAVVPLVALAL